MLELSQPTRAALADLLGPHAGVRNPVDLLAGVGAEEYEQALRLVLADDAVDAVIVIYTDPMISEPAAIVEAVRRAASATPHKTMLACFLAHDLPPAIELVDDGDRHRHRRPAGRARVPVPRVAGGRTRSHRRAGDVADPPGRDGDRPRRLRRRSCPRGA